MAAIPAPLKARAAVRAFALGLPGTVEEFPWEDDAVIKVNKKIFVFLGAEGNTETPGISVKLKDEEAHGHALAVPGAAPTGYGLGRSGWVSVPLTGDGGAPVELLCDWVEESYRTIAPKRLVAELDAA
ncbi:MmcQ/YjbR family DNA-binding protein [Streptomyces albireticuli]|uniref:dGTPase n=1 Tax=Streptomyces albireticuli TaxID=1940 RepID=A0A2A2D471_9ACTN|nr:MmcQ/YjbR family DNA-binding protein [Streptomyces albireticuli]MCD9140901.1 MmcQ/YjbR family DNA-binding protein [Streptomyces albireticuli]MCD9161137.1 MmcQ/YjbR family DNA-binding protein [Streptomyces albireticuli]MCD9190805.1 MmcQ/YjbR family DNA-binding protein [Streptomyces albireticuli]PAU46130.1 dGTPase [Streptomyces albireticuli]